VKSLSNFKPYEVMYVDAMNLSARSYYGMSDLEYHGRKTGMLYGIARLFIAWMKKAPGIEIVMLWEGKDSWRKAKYPIYKANRGESRTPEESRIFWNCVERVKTALPIMGVRQAWSPTYEADDVVANFVAAEIESAGAGAETPRRMLLSSGDWDWWELADYSDILYQHKDVLTREDMCARFEKKFKAPMVPFDRLWLFKVLTGSHDNVSGIPLFPKKLASKLCNLKDIDEGSIIHALVRLGEKKWAERVAQHNWIMNRNVELLRGSEIPLEDIEWIDGEYSKTGFGDILLKNGMETLYDRFMEVR